MKSENMAWLTSIRKIETHGELAYDVAWCSQPHRMGHGLHPNQNSGYDDDDDENIDFVFERPPPGMKESKLIHILGST